MSRIFISLSLLPMILVCATMGVGWWIGDYNGVVLAKIHASNSDPEKTEEAALLETMTVLQEPSRRFNIHFQLGLASALAVVLINSLSVTYLIGTSRWIKEVCEAYELGPRHVDESKKLKRQTFPWSIVGVCSILVAVAFGAASDPGTGRAGTAEWVVPHAIAAMLGACLIIWAIIVQAINLHANSQIIDQVVEEVRRERVARGLDV